MAATARGVDLTNVKEGGIFRPRRKPEGDYRGKIVKADDHQPNDKSKAMGWVLTIQVEGDARSTYAYYLSPDPKQAWKIRQICIAAGINVKTARIKFDPNKLVNKNIGLALEDDEYEGRPKSTIADVFPVSEVGGNADEDIVPDDDEEIVDDELEGDYADDEEEEEEAPPVRTRKTRQKPAPEPEPEDDEEEEEEPEPVKPVRRRKAAPPPVEEDDEEEEEEPAPAPKRRRTTAPATKRVAAARKPAPEDDDLDDLDLDELD